MPKLIITIIALLISLFLGLSLDWPKYKEFKNTRQDIAQKQFDIKNQKEKIANLTKVREDLNNYTDALAKIDSALPSDSNLPALFQFLQDSTEQEGLFLKNFPSASSPSSNSSEIKEIRLSLSLTGSYSAFKNYLNVLRKTSRMIEVESLSFSAPEESGIFSFNLSIKTQSY